MREKLLAGARLSPKALSIAVSRPVSATLARWTAALLRRPVAASVTSFVLVALAALGLLTRFEVDPSTEALLVPDSRAAADLQELRDLFGQDARFVVIAHGDVFSLPYLDRLRELHGALAKLDLKLPTLGQRRRDREVSPAQPTNKEDWGEEDDGWGDESEGSIVEQIDSLYNARDTRWTAEGLRIGGLLQDEWPKQSELSALRARVLANPALVGRLVDVHGRHSTIVLRTDFMRESDTVKVHAAIEDLARRHSVPGFEVSVGGAPAMNAAVTVLIQRNAGRLFGLALLVMLGVLAVLFRHPLGVLGPLLVVIQTAVCTFGGMAWLGIPLTITSNILPAFLICVGIGDSIHVQTVYARLRRAGTPHHEAIVEAIARSGVPILFTTATTCVGLLSFGFAKLGAIRDLGLAGAAGVAIALSWTLVTLPLVWRFDSRGRIGSASAGASKPAAADRLLRWCAGTTLTGSARLRRTRWVLVGALALTLPTVLGAARLRSSHDGLRYLPPGHPTRLAVEQLDAHLGGGSALRVLVRTEGPLGVRDAAVIDGMEQLERHALAFRDPDSAQPVVSSATSVLDVLRETWRATHEDRAEAYTVPPTQAGIVDMFTLFESTAVERARQVFTLDHGLALMSFGVRWMDAARYAPLVEHIHEGARRVMPEGTQVRVTGSVVASRAVLLELVTDLLRSFAVALSVITLLMVAVLRDVRLGLLAMIPNLLPIAGVLGFMGSRGMFLDVTNLLIASIAIGIVVDDTIHLLHPFKEHYGAHRDVEAALAFAFERSGRAVLSTSAVLALGFGVFLTASLSNLAAFGQLVVLTVGLALVSDLLLMPVVLRLFYRERQQAAGTSPLHLTTGNRASR